MALPVGGDVTAVLDAFVCPRCGKKIGMTRGMYGPCDPCRELLRRIYIDRDRVRIASLAHLLPEHFNAWLRTPNDDLGGDSPWDFIDAGLTQQVIALVKTLKRLPVEV